MRILWDHTDSYSEMYFIALPYSSIHHNTIDTHKGLKSPAKRIQLDLNFPKKERKLLLMKNIS